MSSELNMYIGGYIELPQNVNWNNLVEELDIVDQLIEVTVNRKKLYISNYGCCNAMDNGDSFKVDLDKSLLLKYEVIFISQHKLVLEKLKEYFKTDIQLKFGAISYWN